MLKQAQQPLDRMDPATPRGFRVDSFTPSAAEVTVWKHQAGQDFLITGRVQWSDDANDWVLTPQHAKIWYEVVTAFLARHVRGEDVELPELLG